MFTTKYFYIITQLLAFSSLWSSVTAQCSECAAATAFCGLICSCDFPACECCPECAACIGEHGEEWEDCCHCFGLCHNEDNDLDELHIHDLIDDIMNISSNGTMKTFDDKNPNGCVQDNGIITEDQCGEWAQELANEWHTTTHMTYWQDDAGWAYCTVCAGYDKTYLRTHKH